MSPYKGARSHTNAAERQSVMDNMTGYGVDVTLPPSQARQFSDRIAAFRSDEEILDVTVVVLPGFSQLTLASLLEPFRRVNEVAGRQIFRWRIASAEGGQVMSATGISVLASSDFVLEKNLLFRSRAPWSVFICGGEDVERFITPELRGLLRAYSRQSVPLFGLGTGAWVLAASGLLKASKCTIHWKSMAAFAETYRDLDISDALYVSEGKTTSCAGEFATFDLVASIVQALCGDEMVKHICRLLIADRWRDSETRQAMPLTVKLSGASVSLVQAIWLMESNLQVPLPMRDIARRVGLSQRQIERLFLKYISKSPWNYYVSLRLEKGRQLLRQTSLPINEIAFSCGFTNSSHFSNCFRYHYGASPSSMRDALPASIDGKQHWNS